MVNHLWITTEGVFGIALGVSTSFVFLFVLFGSLLDKAGAGNYFIKVAFSLMGHLRGGPAKAAVVSSAMTGLISGSSIANVVTTGTFTIPLMKRVGFSAEKAGAVEVASSVNGQIMPPVMGAAAFLMVEYVGIPYFEVVKHAFLPAVISYIALVYIVHLEAVKTGMKALPRAVEPKPWLQLADRPGLHHRRDLRAVSFAVYYGMGWITPGLRRGCRLDRLRPAGRGLCRPALDRVARRAAARWTIRTQPVTKLPRARPDGALGPAFHPADRRAGLGADGRPAVAGPLGLLGGGVHDLHPGHPAAAHRPMLPRHAATSARQTSRAASST